MEISDAAALLLGHAKKEIDKGFKNLDLPHYMKEGVRLWVLKGVTPGDFLKGVLVNNFILAVTTADQHNSAKLQEWGKFIYCYLPRDSWGSELHFEDWRTQGGLEGLYYKIEKSTKDGVPRGTPLKDSTPSVTKKGED